MPAMIVIPKHKRAMPKRMPKVPPMEGFSDPEEQGEMSDITLPKGAEPIKPGETKEVVIEVKGGDTPGKVTITKYNGIPMDGASEEAGEGEPPKDESFVGAAMPGEEES